VLRCVGLEEARHKPKGERKETSPYSLRKKKNFTRWRKEVKTASKLTFSIGEIPALMEWKDPPGNHRKREGKFLGSPG